MEDQNPTPSERGSLRREETRHVDLEADKANTVRSSNKDQVTSDITPWQHSPGAMEEANKEEVATDDARAVQAMNASQKRDSYIRYARNFEHNLDPQWRTEPEEEEFHVLDLSIHSRRATAVQENGYEEEPRVSLEQAVCEKGRENSEKQDGSRKRERIGTEKKPVSKKRFHQDTTSTGQERIHTEVQSHICPECGKSFHSSLTFTEHQSSHTGYLTKHRGSYAGGEPDNASERVNTEDLRHICAECGKSFSSLLSLTEHQRSHTGHLAKYQETYTGGKLDLSSERSNTEDQGYTCLECWKPFSSFLSFTEHQRSHAGDAARWQRTHARNELYTCSECGECFYSFSLFIDHQKSHTKDKTFTLGRGHVFSPWVLPDSQKAVPGQQANRGQVLGDPSYSLPYLPIWVPYSLPHPTFSHPPLMLPVPNFQPYIPTPLLPAQTSNSYPQGSTASAPSMLTPSGSLPQGGTPSRFSGSQKDEEATSAGSRFVGANEPSTNVSEDWAESTLRQILETSQTNHTGQHLFPCLDCGELKVNATQLTLHRRDCKKDGALRCSRCKKRFPNEPSLREHEKTHTSKKT
nr:zinc finger protein 2 homolog isoform X2 [Pogona vitticeps]